MSRSKNARSRYATVPDYLRVSLAVRDSGANRRSRDLRGREKHDVRVLIETILEDSREVSNHDA